MWARDIHRLFREGRAKEVLARAAARLELDSGTEGLGELEATLHVAQAFGSQIEHDVFLVVSGSDDTEKAETLKRTAPDRIHVHQASPQPFGGDLEYTWKVFAHKREIVRRELARYGGCDICDAYLSSVGATGGYGLCVAHECAKLHRRQSLVVETRLPPDQPLSKYTVNLSKILRKMAEVQREVGECVIVPYVAERRGMDWRRIARFRWVLHSTIVLKEDWKNILGSFSYASSYASEEEVQGLVVALPILIEGSRALDLKSRAQNLTRGSTDAFLSSQLELKPLDSINVAVAVAGPAREEELSSVAEDIMALLKSGIVSELGWSNPGAGGVISCMQSSQWAAAALIGPLVLKAVRVGDLSIPI
jgi:hypothetical protein